MSKPNCIVGMQILSYVTMQQQVAHKPLLVRKEQVPHVLPSHTRICHHDTLP